MPLFGFRIGYKSKRGLEVFFEVKNLTDRSMLPRLSRWAILELKATVRSIPVTGDRSTPAFHGFGSLPRYDKVE